MFQILVTQENVFLIDDQGATMITIDDKQGLIVRLHEAILAQQNHEISMRRSIQDVAGDLGDMMGLK